MPAQGLSSKQLMGIIAVLFTLWLAALGYIWTDTRTQWGMTRTGVEKLQDTPRDIAYALSRIAVVETGLAAVNQDARVVREEQQRRTPIVNEMVKQVEVTRNELIALRLLLEERNNARQNQISVMAEQLRILNERLETMSRRILSLAERQDAIIQERRRDMHPQRWPWLGYPLFDEHF